MSLFDTITKGVRALSAAALTAKLPHEIKAYYPDGSPAAGTPRGRYLLSLDGNGGAKYELKAESPEYVPTKALAALEVRHAFSHPPSLLNYLRAWPAMPAQAGDEDDQDVTPAIFLHTPPRAKGEIVALLDEPRPELGRLKSYVDRHPVWAALSALAKGDPLEVSHVEIADLLQDHQDRLVKPEMAMLVSRFSGAVRMDYDASLDQAMTTSVRIAWKGTAKNEQGAEVVLPRSFEMNVPPFVGLWEPGSEPSLRAVISIRPVPPAEGAVVPRFRLRWVNAAEFELGAQRLAQDALRSLVASIWGEASSFAPPVYLGVPDVVHMEMPILGPGRMIMRVGYSDPGREGEVEGVDVETRPRTFEDPEPPVGSGG